MKNQPGYYFLFLICCCFFTSCLSRKYSHYPRVKIDPQPEVNTEPIAPLVSAKEDGPQIDQLISEQDQLMAEEKKEFPSVVSHHISQPAIKSYSKNIKLPQHQKLKKVNKVKRFGDGMEVAGVIIWFIIIGLPSILLVVAGFIMGYFNIMVGFWICWVLGMLGIILSCLAGIGAWAVDGKAWIVINAIFYLLMFCMAIAFILIVLLI